MISRPSDFLPDLLKNELLRLARIDRNWAEFEWTNRETQYYRARAKYKTWLSALWQHGAECWANLAASTWLIDGPKIFRPTPEQCEAFEQIDVNLELHEYEQPYPAILVDLPEEKYKPYRAALCYKADIIAVHCISDDAKNDITICIAVDGYPIENSLAKYDGDCFGGDGTKKFISPEDCELAAMCHKAARIGVNSCLALVNFGCYAKHLFPKEVERDRKLAIIKPGKAAEAKDRIELASRIVNFTHEVKLHHEVNSSHDQRTYEETGREVKTHWRRGHWAMQVCGAGRSQRKRILRKPVLVRADRITEQERISTVYRT